MRSVSAATGAASANPAINAKARARSAPNRANPFGPAIGAGA